MSRAAARSSLTVARIDQPALNLSARSGPDGGLGGIGPEDARADPLDSGLDLGMRELRRGEARAVRVGHGPDIGESAQAGGDSVRPAIPAAGDRRNPRRSGRPGAGARGQPPTADSDAAPTA